MKIAFIARETQGLRC